MRVIHRHLTTRRAAIAAVAFAILALTVAPRAQEYTGTILVSVAPDRATWTYATGEPVTFRISVLRDGLPIDATAHYEVGPDGFPLAFPATMSETVPIPKAGLQVKAGTMKAPGFLRCIVTVTLNGKTYRGLATAGFSPEKIQAYATEAKDFDAFWAKGKEALAAIPMDARLTPLPSYSTSKADVYQVDMKTIGLEPTLTSKIYGILCEPKTGEKLPALLLVPGAGVRPYAGAISMCEKGIITLQIGIHGIPVTYDVSLYDDLRAAALYGYNSQGLTDPERYYFHRVYLSCLRANDFLTSRPRWDGSHLAVTGGSQGGALSLVTAALDPRVKGLAASYPALADQVAYLKGRAASWPYLFRADRKGIHEAPRQLATIEYYDAVNFAKRVRVPGIYTFGFNDETVSPSSAFATFNSINAPKRLVLALETGHRRTPEQEDVMDAWLEALLKGQSPPMTAETPRAPQ